jgi:TPR repeat protein
MQFLTSPKAIHAFLTEVHSNIAYCRTHNLAAEKLCYAASLTHYNSLLESNDNPIKQRQNIFKSFQQASEQGALTATFIESIMLQNGYGCSLDVTNGQALMQILADIRELPQALLYKAKILINAQERSRKKLAIENLQKAAQQSYNPAIFNLACCYIYGIKGVITPEPEKGARLLLNAGSQGQAFLKHLCNKIETILATNTKKNFEPKTCAPVHP